MIYRDPEPSTSPWAPEATLAPAMRPAERDVERGDESPAEFRAIVQPALTEMGLDGADVRTLTELLGRHLSDPVPEAERREWERDLLGERGLAFGYGAKGLAERQAAVADYLDRRPDFRAMLLATGVASHPRVVSMLLNRALALPRK